MVLKLDFLLGFIAVGAAPGNQSVVNPASACLATEKWDKSTMYLSYALLQQSLDLDCWL